MSATAAAPDLRAPETDEEIAACYPAMRELRPHLANPASFLAQVRRQMAEGYRLLALWRDRRVVACAGYRLQENLIRGRHLYVDDLVTLVAERSRGHGTRLLDALTMEACAQGCHWLVLDSGVGLAGAHRFYFRHGLTITAFRFGLPLG